MTKRIRSIHALILAIFLVAEVVFAGGEKPCRFLEYRLNAAGNVYDAAADALALAITALNAALPNLDFWDGVVAADEQAITDIQNDLNSGNYPETNPISPERKWLLEELDAAIDAFNRDSTSQTDVQLMVDVLSDDAEGALDALETAEHAVDSAEIALKDCLEANE